MQHLPPSGVWFVNCISSVPDQVLRFLPVHILTQLWSCPPPPRQVARPLPGVPAGRHGRRSAARRALVFKRPGERRERLLGLWLRLQGERIPRRCGRTSWSHRYEHGVYVTVTSAHACKYKFDDVAGSPAVGGSDLWSDQDIQYTQRALEWVQLVHASVGTNRSGP